MKKTTIYLSSWLLILWTFMSVYSLWKNGTIHFWEKIKMELLYVTDFRDEKKLLWASHNVILGTVLEKKWTVRFPWDMPGEVYSLQVKENIKWKEDGMIDIIKEGWCLDGKCYTLTGDSWYQSESYDDNLDVWRDYIFALRKDSNYGYIVISHPSAQIKAEDGTINKKKLKSLYHSYVNETPFEWDILSWANKNAFAWLSQEEKKRIHELWKED